jgi:hypothetical protein
MDKVLTRKLFKDRYLQTVSKRISNFKEGGLASLRAKHYQVGGISEGERTAMLLQPLVSQLLVGTRQPGQSQLGSVAQNIGAALPQVVKTRLDIDKAETERLDQLAKLAKAKQDETKPGFTKLTEEQKQKVLGPATSKEDVVVGKIDPKTGNILDYKVEYKEQEDISKASEILRKTNIENLENKIDAFLNHSAKYYAKSRGKDLPGFGVLDQYAPNTLVEDNGLARTLLAEIRNTKLKAEAGTAVSASESDRIMEALGGGAGGTSVENVMTQVLKLKEEVEKQKENALRDFKPNVLSTVTEKGLVKFSEAPAVYDVLKKSKKELFTKDEDRNVFTQINEDGSKVKYRTIGDNLFVLSNNNQWVPTGKKTKK